MALAVVLAASDAPTSVPAAAARRLTDAEVATACDRFLGTEWFGVYLLGEKIGWMSTTLAKAPDGASYLLTSEFMLKVKTLNVVQVTEVKETRTYSGPGWRLAQVHLTQTSGNRTAEMAGRVKDGAFEFTHILAGAPRVQRLALPEESLADAMTVQMVALDPNARPGAEATFRQFDATVPAEYHCVATLRRREERPLEGVKTPVVIVDIVIKELNLPSTTTLLPNGRALEFTLAGLFKARRETETVARRLDVPIDPLALGAIRMKTELLDPANLRELVLLATGVPDDARLKTDRQTYDPTDTPGEFLLTLKRSEWKPEAITPGPYDREKFGPYLAATPFIQSDDRRIADLARQIVGDEPDPLNRVRRLVHWVFANIRKEYTAALSSAVDVLETRSGDCTEHSILFVALCRAAGIPADTVAGVLYAKDFGGFVYHAWARVYVGAWIEVDPTWDQAVADPTHIAFAIGPLERQAGIVRLIGQVRLRYVSSSK